MRFWQGCGGTRALTHAGEDVKQRRVGHFLEELNAHLPQDLDI